MSEKTPQETDDSASLIEASESVDASVEAMPATDESAPPDAIHETPEPDSAKLTETPVSDASESESAPTTSASDNISTQDKTPESSEPQPPKEPDELQPFIDKAFETIQHEVESTELDKFLRAHIKTFREEWDIWPDNAKDAYVHMMTSQLLQRKAARTRIMNYEPFKLPVPSAQTTLFESIKQSQIKPKKCVPVLLMPPNLRPTYSLKK